MNDDSAAREIATTYFRSWVAKDFDELGSVLADEVTFRGPLGTANDKQTCLQGLRGMARVLDDVVVYRMAVTGSEEQDVLTWFDLHTSIAPPTPTVNWSTIRDGRIVAIRVTFDPRPILAAM